MCHRTGNQNLEESLQQMFEFVAIYSLKIDDDISTGFVIKRVWLIYNEIARKVSNQQ